MAKKIRLRRLWPARTRQLFTIRPSAIRRPRGPRQLRIRTPDRTRSNHAGDRRYPLSNCQLTAFLVEIRTLTETRCVTISTPDLDCQRAFTPTFTRAPHPVAARPRPRRGDRSSTVSAKVTLQLRNLNHAPERGSHGFTVHERWHSFRISGRTGRRCLWAAPPGPSDVALPLLISRFAR